MNQIIENDEGGVKKWRSMHVTAISNVLSMKR